MIIEFSASNFRSIAEERTFSLYATGSQGGRLTNTVPLGGTPYRILKTVGIYGANASGKTNLFLALDALRKMVRWSHHFHEGEKIRCYEPCSFNGAEEKKETRFQLEFVCPYDGKQTRFVYVLAYTDVEITYEKLTAYFTNRESLLFERDISANDGKFVFGAAYKGGTRNIACFPNQAYLSVAGQNAGAPPIVRQIVAYITRRIATPRVDCIFIRDVRQADERAWNLVSHIDVGVESVKLEEHEVSEEALNLPPDMPRDMKNDVLNRARKRIVLKHSDDKGASMRLDLDEESKGTRKMVRLLPQVADILVSGGVFVVDELDNSMHPFMAEMLVKLFNDPDVNQGQAQLIFTTHNANLLSQELLRRDQIWFAEKVGGRSRYYSLDSFDKKVVTPYSPYIKWYLEGRFGAIPSIDYAAIVRELQDWRERAAEDAKKA